MLCFRPTAHSRDRIVVEKAVNDETEVSLGNALVLYLMQPREPSDEGGKRFVVLSTALHTTPLSQSGRGLWFRWNHAIAPVFLCVSLKTHRSPRLGQRGPRTSNRTGDPSPCIVPCIRPTDHRSAACKPQWVDLTKEDGGDSATLQAHIERQRNAQESGISEGMQQRCTQIQSQAEDEDFVHSLEYYTTGRVKHAFLCMNAQGLVDRLREVQDLVDTLRAILCRSDDAYAAAFVIPPPSEDEEQQQQSLGLPGDDPNALCFPQHGDYALDV